MREKLQVVLGFKITKNKEDGVELFKAIKSTVFRFDNKCNIYVATANIISHFWQNLIDDAKEHGAMFGLHIELLKTVAANPLSPTYDEKALKEELHNGLTQGWNGYPNSIKEAYMMICKRQDQDTPKIPTKTQLAFLTKGGGGGEEDEEKEIVLPAGGGKVRPYIKCNKCGKKRHYTNKCPDLFLPKNKETGISAFIIDDDELGGEDSSGENEFIFLTAKHKMVNKNMLLLNNQSSTNIVCNRQYVTNISK
eukprot:14053919-Ditylum_brightwellii.AAC.1